VPLILRGRVRNGGLLFAIVVWVAIVASQNDNFLTSDNLRVIGLNMAFAAIAAIGTAVLIISGNVDLSIGSAFAMTAITAAELSSDVPTPLAFALAIMLGGAIGGLNGLLCWLVPISPIVITLGSLALIRGIVLVWTQNAPVVDTASDFTDFARASPFGIPMPVIVMVVVLVLTAIVMRYTTIGRHLYAVGGNRAACQAAGIRVRRLVIGAFAFGGLLVGLAGVLAASRFDSPDATYGTGFELDVITGVLLGGVSFAGGEGTVPGAVLGVLALTLIDSGLVAIGIDPFYSDVVQGGLLIAAVSADQVAHVQRERFQKAMAMREQVRLAEERVAALAADGQGGTAAAEAATEDAERQA
jgi:ribose/xylose/arabinose/galactoside ABC-type transport system permease subunit